LGRICALAIGLAGMFLSNAVARTYVCHDGDPRCDADHICNGACTFAICDPAGCTSFDLPLRAGRKRARRLVGVGQGRRRAVLRCLPPRGLCLKPTTTTVVSPPATLPGTSTLPPMTSTTVASEPSATTSTTFLLPSETTTSTTTMVTTSTTATSTT